MNVMKKDTPSSNKPFERGLYQSLCEWLSMNTAFTTFLEIVIISVLNVNPAIQWSDRWNEREEKYKRLLDTWEDKTIPVTMLSDLVQLMQEHHEEKKDIIWEMYENFICQWEHGQFFTPPHIADFMAKIVEVEEVESWNSVVDIACGSGKLLMWALKNNPRVSLIWVDIDRRCAMMATINCLFYGGCGTFLVGNTLCNEYETWWKVSYWMLYEIPREELDQIRFNKNVEVKKSEEKSQSVPLEKVEELTENLKTYEVQGAIQKSLF